MGRSLSNAYGLYLKTRPAALSDNMFRAAQCPTTTVCLPGFHTLLTLQDLAGMGRSLSNAYGLYLKTRPAASSESARRSKALAPEGCHPLLLAAVKHKSGGTVDMQVRGGVVSCVNHTYCMALRMQTEKFAGSFAASAVHVAAPGSHIFTMY
jgi:hypothetical protein